MRDGMLVAFVVVQFAPGGPVEQVIAKLTGAETGASSRISGSAGGDFGSRGMLIQAQMVDLLRDLQKRHDLTYMFISHDLRVVAALASRLLVMRHGKVVEEGAAAELFKAPKSDYTRALFAAAFKLEIAPEGVVSQ